LEGIMEKVSIVIPAYITKPAILLLTKQLLEGLIFKTKHIEDCEIILVDDGSDAKNISYLSRIFPQIKIISNDVNKGFAKSVNRGINVATNDLILLLNNDVQILESGWLLNLINGMNYYNYDVASVKDSVLNESFDYVPDARRAAVLNIQLRYPVGWCLLVKRKVFEQVGLLPLEFGVGFWEDTAWAYVIRNKHKQIKMGIIPKIDNVQLRHFEHQTFKAIGMNIMEQYNKNRKTFLDIVVGKDLVLPKLGEG